jgi:DNA repair photolyase
MHLAKGALPRGRGTGFNPANRFDRIAYKADPGEEPEAVETQIFADASKSVLTDNDSPDIAMERSLNPYRGCAHGCVYCFARPYHEYLGLSAGLDFETKLFAKLDAPKLLRAELSKPRYVPKAVALSSVTDAYQPIEKQFQLTRRCLEVMVDFRHPVFIVTKNALVERDVDLLVELAKHNAVVATISVTTLDDQLQRALEPRASTPQARLRAIKTLSDAGVPVGVNAAPIIPGLTDHEMPAILAAARDAGARRAMWTLVRLPYAVKDLFVEWLEQRVPLRKNRVIGALKELHGGKLYNSEFGTRRRGQGPKADQLRQLFDISCRRLGLNKETFNVDASAFRQPARAGQLELF